MVVEIGVSFENFLRFAERCELITAHHFMFHDAVKGFDKSVFLRSRLVAELMHKVTFLCADKRADALGNKLRAVVGPQGRWSIGRRLTSILFEHP
jgi:hypothetical protein